MPGTERPEHVGCQSPISCTDLHKIEWAGGNEEARHLGHLVGDQIAEKGTYVDAGEEVARLPCSPGDTRVVTEVGVVEREVHERGHRRRAAFMDELGNLQAVSVGG